MGGGSLMKVKRCAPAGDCVSGFINLGSIKMSSSCCNTDLCNDKDAPDPSNVPNGKRCYHCDGHNCSSILHCAGSEDRCFTATGMLLLAKGCVSKSVCNATELFSPLRISCCEGNMCNGAQSFLCEGNLCNGAQNITQSFLCNGTPSITQSFLCNGAQNITQSFLEN
uniref:Snake toxin/toxin-like domain-containing protein n=1 Tax=Sinocyclocheilus grahami TaxID=75366 RepID=A0A672JYU3_SINGR